LVMPMMKAIRATAKRMTSRGLSITFSLLLLTEMPARNVRVGCRPLGQPASNARPSFSSRAGGGRQQSFDLAHDAMHVLLILQRDHKKLIPLLKTDHAVREEPDAAQ